MWSNMVSASRYAAMPFEVMTRLTARLMSTPIPMKAPPALRPFCVNCQQAHHSLSGSDVDGSTGIDLPSTTHSGYLSIDRGGAALFYVYYAARDVPPENAPVLLWLQGGPGASSLMGNFYELIGPQKVTKNLRLRDNPWAWNRYVNLLFIEQPLGTGYSVPGTAKVPGTLLESSQDLYAAVQNFFQAVLGPSNGQRRQLLVGGESYAGKFVPGLAHVIVELAEREAGAKAGAGLRVREGLPLNSPQLKPPVFDLIGVLIGNGLTDPLSQVVTMPEAAYFQGVIDDEQRDTARRIVGRILELAEAGQWEEGHTQRLKLIEFLTASGGLGTTLDIRRYEGYDGKSSVLQYLNQPEVKKALGVAPEVEWIRKNPVVKTAMYADNLRTAKPLVPDILAAIPVLLYQGATDIQDGVASNEAWIYDLDWPGRDQFNTTPRELLHLGSDKETLTTHKPQDPAAHPQLQQGRVVGYYRSHGPLTHVMLRNAGHMAPHDEPDAARAMFESWLHTKVLKTRRGPGPVVEGDWVAVAA